MPLENALHFAFNRGLMDTRALARTDLKRTALSAHIQTNWMPRTLGSMMLRAGLGYIDSTLNDLKAIHLPFIFRSDDTALIELTDTTMRVRVDEEIISRSAITTAVTNGSFNTDLSGWTDADESGATSAWVTGGYMGLTGTGINVALRTQEVTVSVGDAGKEHALRIIVARGPVKIRIGSTSGADDYLGESTLRTGTYSIAFTPSGNFHIWVFNSEATQKLISSIEIEAAGAMQFDTPWLETDLPYIRCDQSGDVIFVACNDRSPKRIERFGARSWGIADYSPIDGPFRAPNTSSVTLTPGALTGNTTLTASFNRFRADQVGALFKVTSNGQNVEVAAAGNGQWTNPIKITGVGTERQFSVDIAGTWTGTVIIQRSDGAPGSWVDTVNTYTGNTSTTINDGYDNQITYYRIGFDAGYGSGTANLGLSYANGGLTGIARVTAFNSATSLDVEVLSPFGSTSGSVLWSEGAWSDYRGWPSAVTFFEGRLWWAGKDNLWGTVSDAFESFNDEVEGDSGPILRSLGSGPVSRINWLLALQRLVIGTDSDERIAKSSSLDEPLTPTNFSLKSPSSQGSAAIQAAKVDNAGVFVQRGGTRLFNLGYQGEYQATDYTNEDMSIIAPLVGESGFSRIAVQRQPDTRIHCVRADGKVAVLVYDKLENVQCWILVETVGAVEDAVILPGPSGVNEDKVYYVVRRTINGQTKRYLEKWALETECTGLPEARLADSHIVYSGSETTVITGLDHLEGEEVIVWGWNTATPFTVTSPSGSTVTVGKDMGTFTVSGGQITGLSSAVTNATIGLAYTASFKSTKLAYAAGLGTALTQMKRVNYLGLIMANVHAQGLKYGQDFDTLDDMPMMESGVEVDENYVWDEYDNMALEFPGDWSADSRICLQAAAPRPCTVLAAVISVRTSDRI